MPVMRAVRIHSYGDAGVLTIEDAPRPTPGEGEVLIRIFATSINPFDVALRSGYMAGMLNCTLPLIPGTDISGIVEEAGPGVTGFKPGDEVYARGGVTRDGAYAEYAVVPQTDVAAKPKSLDHVKSAALPHVALTAWQALYVLADLQPGQTVLIHGAGGGVGHVAAQLAKLRGAKVIGTASLNIDLVRELGVDQVIDYSATRFEDEVHDVDVVLDTIGGDTQERSWAVLKPGGILVSVIQPPSPEVAAAHGVRGAMVWTSPPIGEVLAAVAALSDAGQIKPHVSAVFSLEQIPDAHRLIENKHARGKIGVQVHA
jgi:NADPH:quinone reductase-like Zn-dependent oxidoreductase